MTDMEMMLARLDALEAENKRLRAAPGGKRDEKGWLSISTKLSPADHGRLNERSKRGRVGLKDVIYDAVLRHLDYCDENDRKMVAEEQGKADSRAKEIEALAVKRAEEIMAAARAVNEGGKGTVTLAPATIAQIEAATAKEKPNGTQKTGK